MTACRTCGADECANFDFCRACRDADHRRKARALPEDLTRLQRLIGSSVSLERAWDEINRAARERYNQAPEHTYKAVQYELRNHGLAQLKQAKCQRRLNELSPAQIKELIASLQRCRSQYPKISDELLTTLGAIYDGRMMAHGQ